MRNSSGGWPVIIVPTTPIDRDHHMWRTVIRSVLGHTLECRAMRIVTPDAVGVAVQDWTSKGVKPGRDLLFIHGFSQAHEAFLKQFASPLAQKYRLVTYDLRGHGDSDKPLEASYYREPLRWADEIRTVIEQVGLERPVLVPWSYGGRVVLDYLTAYGDGGIGGLIMVNATAKSSPEVLGPAIGALKAMTSPDGRVALDGTKKLLEECVVAPLSSDELEYMLAYNTKVPAQIRMHLAGRPADYDLTLRALRVPTLVIHGKRDRVNTSLMATYAAEVVPNARLSFYDDAAHMPFWDSAERFNADIGNFVGQLG
jgi:non-heme chloroperoxidase